MGEGEGECVNGRSRGIDGGDAIGTFEFPARVMAKPFSFFRIQRYKFFICLYFGLSSNVDVIFFFFLGGTREFVLKD